MTTKTNRIAAAALALTALAGTGAIAATTIIDKIELKEARAVEAASVKLDAVIAAAEERSGARAIEAEAEVEGGESYYEVETVAADGTVQTHRFGFDGAYMDTTDGDEDDREDLNGVAAASLTLADGIRAALAATNGTVTEAEYDDEDGKLVIETEIVSGDTLTEVYVDAQTGDVLAAGADDDEDEGEDGRGPDGEDRGNDDRG